MAISIAARGATRPRPRARGVARPLPSIAFDWAIVATSGWFVAGLYLDGWAHNTIPSLETFFTPWHGVLYSGFLASLAVLGWAIGRNRATGRTWWQAIPAGYELSLVGGLLFVASGLADMLWHIVFGIEANVEALLSPTHLSLLLGGTLFLTGPLRSATRRGAVHPDVQHWSALLPRLLSLSYVLLSLAFFTQYANPWGGPWLASDYRPLTSDVLTAGGRGLEAVFLFQALNVAGVLLQSVLLAGVTLVALRGGRVPMGGFTLLIGGYVVLTVLMRQKYDAGLQVPLALAGLLAGGSVDLLYARLRSSLPAAWAIQTFTALVPALVTAASVLGLAAAQGVWWTIHLWAGAVVLAAATGWLVSLVATAGAQPRPVPST